MDYPGVDLASFARNAGFDDGGVIPDVRFPKQPARAKVLCEQMADVARADEAHRAVERSCVGHETQARGSVLEAARAHSSWHSRA
jgi:hypothetical protein